MDNKVLVVLATRTKTQPTKYWVYLNIFPEIKLKISGKPEEWL